MERKDFKRMLLARIAELSLLLDDDDRDYKNKRNLNQMMSLNKRILQTFFNITPENISTREKYKGLYL